MLEKYQTDLIHRSHDLLAENFVIHNHQVERQILRANANGAVAYNRQLVANIFILSFRVWQKKHTFLKNGSSSSKGSYRQVRRARL